MKTLEDLGELVLGTRLKRLSDQLYSDVDAVYKELDIALPANCCALLALLHNNGPMGVTELADALGQTHSAVSQTSKKLCSLKVVTGIADPSDSRRRLLEMTDQGEKMLLQVQDVWDDVIHSVREAVRESNLDFMAALAVFEVALNNTPLRERITARRQQRQKDNIKIVPFCEQYRADFRRLNVEWLEKYFYLEEIDDRVLSNPEEYILNPGGHILLAQLDNKIIGTAALLKHGDDCFELTKMSVSESYQGLGIGRKLANAAIEKFLSSGTKTLFLETSSRLIPAIKLYESLGFEHNRQQVSSHYQRSNVHMIYNPDRRI